MTNPADFESWPTPEQRERLDKRFAEIYGPDFGRALDSTDEERLSLLQEVDSLCDDYQQIGQGLHVAIQGRISELAGEHITGMLHSAEEAEQYLESGEASLRLAALYLLYHHWRQTDSYAHRYERFAMCDSNEDVRIVALAHLGSYFSYTNDGRVSRMLASVVLDANEANAIRLAAYRNLVRVHGNLTGVRGMCAVSFPDAVNWGFVDRWSR
jgi:hypothetical protein